MSINSRLDSPLGRVRTFSEVSNQVFVVVNGIILLDHAELLQLSFQRPLSDGRLCDVGTVQVVHAIRSNHASLQLYWLRLVGIEVEIADVPTRR